MLIHSQKTSNNSTMKLHPSSGGHQLLKVPLLPRVMNSAGAQEEAVGFLLPPGLDAELGLHVDELSAQLEGGTECQDVAHAATQTVFLLSCVTL